MKKIISIIMVTLTILTMLILPVSAANKVTVYLPTNRSWSETVVCSLNKKNFWGKRKSGEVRVTAQLTGVNVDVRLSNGSKVLWQENNAIVCPTSKAGKTASVYRDFYLGNNNKKYYLSFRCSKKCIKSPTVTVKNIKNCYLY
ncbi:MAG: hypothetical protein IJW86_09560 [Clostridia bacterium]|nr:hypothetical protein [Clostridia bacterium]